MSQSQLNELQALVEGLVAGRLIEARDVPRKTIVEISRNAGRYVAGQLREVVVAK
jgi:hypothetical protein